MKNVIWYQTFKIIHGSEESFMKDVTIETNLKRAKKLINKLKIGLKENQQAILGKMEILEIQYKD